ncbi:MAG: preprotein translocase subunit SecG [Blastocatellia bacterium]
MIYLLYTVYVLACVFLILVILLQSGKGGDVAAAFGGAGSQTAFGPRGAQKPLEKATIVAAILFMVLALLFSLPGVIGGSSVVGEAPAPTPSPAAPATAATASPAASVAASPSASAAASPSASAAASPAKKDDARKSDAKASPTASPAKP